MSAVYVQTFLLTLSLATQQALNLKIYAILLILIVPELLFIYFSIRRLVGKSIKALSHVINIIADFDFPDQNLGYALITTKNTHSMSDAIVQIHLKLKHSNAEYQAITSSLNEFAIGIKD